MATRQPVATPDWILAYVSEQEANVSPSNNFMWDCKMVLENQRKILCAVEETQARLSHDVEVLAGYLKPTGKITAPGVETKRVNDETDREVRDDEGMVSV